MDDQRTDAPELELSAHTDEPNEDSLQLTPSDSVAGFVFGEEFDVKGKATDPQAAKPAAEAPAPKPARPVKTSVLNDAQFVAALLGQPRPESKKAKKQSEQPKAKPAVVTEEKIAAPEPIEAATVAKADPVPAVPAPVIEAAPPAVVEVAVETVAKSEVPAAVNETPAPIVEAAKPEPIVAAEAPSPAPAPASMLAEIAPPKPARAAKPVGPVVATAPVTTFEPELLPEVVAGPQVIDTTAMAAAAVAQPLPDAEPIQKIDPVAAAVEPAQPAIAVLSGVEMPAAAEPAPIVTPAPKAEEPKKLAPQPTPKPLAAQLATETEEEEEETPDPSSLADDFAIPIPAKSAADAARDRFRAEKTQKIEVKPVVLTPEQMPATGAWWTLPIMFVGLVMVACALIVPVADENHRAAYELAKIERDVAHFQQQSDVNQSFLSRVSTDPTLAQRLAMRQLNMIRPNEQLAPLKERHDAFAMSPFAMVSVAPPAPLPAYRPIAGFLSEWFLSPRCQTYLAGLGLLLTAAGVVFGGGGKKDEAARQQAGVA